jgi:hypothetical protein
VIEELASCTGVVVEEMSVEQAREVDELPLAQRRTSSHKAPVRVSPTQPIIYKGPYPLHSLKLVNNLRYPYLIDLMEQTLQLPGTCRGVFRWDKLLCTGSGVGRTHYLAGKNVGCPARMRVVEDGTQVDRAFRVVERGTLLRRVSEREKQKHGSRYVRHPDFDEQLAVASLQHLYFRCLLNVGDNGTHNILIREDWEESGRKIAGIDFDEQRRGQERQTALGHFFKKEDSYLEAIYGDFLPRIVRLERLDASLEAAIAALNALCENWLNSLPAPRRGKHLSETAIRVEDVRARIERMGQLLPPAIARGGPV